MGRIEDIGGEERHRRENRRRARPVRERTSNRAADEAVRTHPARCAMGVSGKNCKDLAMPISQFFAEEVHPEYIIGRSHWKTEFQAESVYVPGPPKLDPESSGASGLVGRASYYGIRRPRRSEDEQLRNGPPGNPATIPCRDPRRGPSAGSHRTGESRQAQSVGAKLKLKHS